MTHLLRFLLPLALLLAVSQPTLARTVTLNVTEDTRLDQLAPNQNRGTLTGLKIASTDRPLVKFAQGDITSAVDGEPLVSAHLELYVATNSNNWSSGLSVEAHRLTATWTELGATFNCGVDSNTGNIWADCSPQWGGGTFVSTATSSVPHDNSTSGWVSFEVKSDVQAFLSGTSNFGWLLKKNSESQSGAVTYGSREGTSGEAPRLVLVMDHEPPSITATVDPPPNAAEWNQTSPVTVYFSCTDDISVFMVPPACPSAVEVEGDGAGQVVPGTATDGVGRQTSTSVTVNLDTASPAVQIVVPEDDTIISSSPVSVSGTVSDSLSGVLGVTCNGIAASVNGSAFTCSVPVDAQVGAIEVQASDVAGNQSVDSINVQLFEPSVPDNTVPTDICEATKFIYTGSDPVQTGVTPGTIDCGTVTIIRGRTLDASGEPLPRVVVSIVDHPELGSTETRSDGLFDIAVNGGGTVTLEYAKDPFLPLRRHVPAPWRDYAWAEDAVLIESEPAGTVDLTTPEFVAAQAPPVEDADGMRQATLLFQPDTTATLKFANGSTQEVDTLNLTATEYTVGASGPARMPAGLPPTSAYTYAIEIDANEVTAAGARGIEFSQPVYFYVQDVLGIPAGTHVPVGVLDPNTAAWAPSPDGLAMQIVGIDGGLAELDITGDGVEDDTTSLGILEDERSELAELYEEGQRLWRVPMTHFSAYDLNFPIPEPNSPPPPPPTPPPKDPRTCPNRAQGSSIEIENQAVSKSLSMTGTAFSLVYHSGRVPGHTISDSMLIPLHTGSVAPNLQRIDLQIRVGGRLIEESFAIPAPQTYEFHWDRKDAYGRVLQGRHPIQVRLGYVYPGVYAIPPSVTRSFGLPSGVPIPGDIPTREPVTLWSEWSGFIGSWDASAEGLGGWSLSVHHVYDPAGRVLHLGTGGTRSTVGQPQTIVTVAGGGTNALICADNGIPATDACLGEPRGVTMAPDGSIYVADAEEHTIRRVDPSGVISTVAGIAGSSGATGDDGPAVNAKLSAPEAVAIGPDGSLYIADRGNFKIRRITPDGVIRTVAGTTQSGSDGDGGPAIGAKLGTPLDVAVAPDGTFYIADAINNRIRRVSPDGFINTYAGGGSQLGDGGPATSAKLDSPNGIALASDGALYIADTNQDRVRRVRVDGVISTVAGGGSLQPPDIGDGGPAVQAVLDLPRRLALGTDGSLYIADDNNIRIRRVLPDGTITTAAGNGLSSISGPLGDGGPPTQARLGHPRGLALGFDGAIYIADLQTQRVRRVDPSLPGYSGETALIPAADLSEIYEFDAVGRHTRTLHPLTGAPLYEFTYNEAGQLVTVSDLRAPNPDFQDTTIERDPNDAGRPTAIIGPFGQRTELVVEDGWLREVINPASEGYEIAYKELNGTNTGLIERFTDPKGNDYFYFYDDETGLLEQELDPADGSLELTRVTTPGAFSVMVVTALGRVVTYIVQFLGAGDELWTSIFDIEPEDPNVPDLNVFTEILADGTRIVTYPDGSTRKLSLIPDPRFRMLAPTTAIEINTGGHELNVSRQRVAALADATDPFSFPLYTTTTTVNTKTWTSVFDPNTLELVETSPKERERRTTLDERGRVVELAVPGVTPVTLTYDEEHGSVKTITQGSRSLVLAYDELGRLETVTDPNSQVVLFDYDGADRVTTQTLQDGREIGLTYDDNGNLETVTPPSDANTPPVHELGYTPINLLERYIPPVVDGSGTNDTVFGHNLDGQLDSIDHPDESTPTSVTLGYDNAGRLQSVTSPTRIVGLQYYAADDNSSGARPGALESISVPQDPNSTLTYTYEGMLLKKEAWSGTVTGSVEYGYDDQLRVTSLKVNNETPTAFGYDEDGLLTSAGAWTLTPDPNNGLLRSTEMIDVSDTLDYTEFGALEDYAATFGSTELFEVQYTYDSLGRIDTKTETIDETTTEYEYIYDVRGRLSDVKENSVLVSHYEYDGNGNRLLATVDGVTVSETLYDDQDRLLTYGDLEYAYTPRGSLLTKTDTTDPNAPATTDYTYDLVGNLTHVTLPDGTAIEYVVDGANRRIGKKVNDIKVQGFLYSGKLQIVAELNGNNQLVSRFVPGGMIKGPETYRILRDHLGSPRLVVNASTGQVVQRMDYDEFGRVIADWEYNPANGTLICGPTDCGPGDPQFQPFGFAGGLYDRQTGLVRFGARDYDPMVGRWTAKDPILFAGGDWNLYAYVRNDAINSLDLTGFGEDEFGCGGPLNLDTTCCKFRQQIYDAVYAALNSAYEGCVDRPGAPWGAPENFIRRILSQNYYCLPDDIKGFLSISAHACASAVRPRPRFGLPGYEGTENTDTDVIFFHSAFDGACGCLSGIVIHETVHNFGVKDDCYCQKRAEECQPCSPDDILRNYCGE